MILIMGYPNAGKTTYSQNYEDVIHLDDFGRGKFAKCNEAVLHSDGNVVVEGIYNTAKRRKSLLDAVSEKNCRKVCIWIQTPLEECLRREKMYRMRGDNVVLVSADMFEEPTYSEGWDEIITIKGGDT